MNKDWYKLLIPVFLITLVLLLLKVTGLLLVSYWWVFSVLLFVFGWFFFVVSVAIGVYLANPPIK